MKSVFKLLSLPLRVSALTYLSSMLVLGNPVVVKDEDKEDVYELSPFEISSGGGLGYSASSSIAGTRMGVTAGGAQDINYARSQAQSGQIPYPDGITPEGLFSEHDLPLNITARTGELLTVGGQAMASRILGLPDSRVLAQIGFASGLDARTWRPEPLNLVVVVDKSGSMSGRPIELVKQSLRQIVMQLGERDQITIVLFGDRAHVELTAIKLTRQNRSLILQRISAIESSGSTAMERGLELGYQVAGMSKQSFEGNTRLMLFTDEQPNVGNTKPGGFMHMMRQGSNHGIGLTTIGVGVNYGVELAGKISAVRGGNLFYFPDYTSMVKTFEDEFDTLVTELACNMRVIIRPESGWKIEGVYGVPGNMLRWLDERSISLNVETLFLSKRKGAIFFSLSPDTDGQLTSPVVRPGTTVAHVDLHYLRAGKKHPTSQSLSFDLVDREDADEGLKRGELLVSQYAGLKKAATDFHEKSDVVAAYRTMKSLNRLFVNSRDSDLKREGELVEKLTKTLSSLVGNDRFFSDHEIGYPVKGIWNAHAGENLDIETDLILTIYHDRYLEVGAYDEEGYLDEQRVAVARDRFSRHHSGVIRILPRESVNHADPDLPFEIGDSDYLSNIDFIKYKISGNRMEAKVYRHNATSPLVITLWRNSDFMEPPFACFSDDVQVDAISGLPIK